MAVLRLERVVMIQGQDQADYPVQIPRPGRMEGARGLTVWEVLIAAWEQEVTRSFAVLPVRVVQQEEALYFRCRPVPVLACLGFVPLVATEVWIGVAGRIARGHSLCSRRFLSSAWLFVCLAQHRVHSSTCFAGLGSG